MAGWYGRLVRPVGTPNWHGGFARQVGTAGLHGWLALQVDVAGLRCILSTRERQVAWGIPTPSSSLCHFCYPYCQ